MANKPSIPSWQRVQPESSTPSPPDVDSSAAKETLPADQPAAPVQDDAKDKTSTDDAPVGDDSAPPPEGASQLEMVESFLAESAMKPIPPQDKRATLASQQVPVETIDQVLAPTKDEARSSIQASDFRSFQSMQTAPTSQRAAAAPIITYPEFLANAHKAPPLVTPRRVLAATYFAGGLATLLYGASTYILNPMRDTLTESRHDFADHSRTRLEEFNDRLSKIVSRVPEPVQTPTPAPHDSINGDDDDNESEASDPTELYHRDMGTQTSSPLPNEDFLPAATPAAAKEQEKDALSYQTTGLTILTTHLTELLEGYSKQEAASKETLQKSTALRHYLDTVMYGGSSGDASDDWKYGASTAAGGGTGAGAKKSEDAVEALKKEIRSVKGVLLSARRFPAAGGFVGRVG